MLQFFCLGLGFFVLNQDYTDERITGLAVVDVSP